MLNGRKLPRSALVVAVLGLVGLLVLAACDMGAQTPQPPTPIATQPSPTPAGPGPSGVPTPSTPSSGLPSKPPSTPASAPPSTPGAGSGLPRITYEVTGGFIGVQEVLDISTSGQARLSGKSGPLNSKQLEPERLENLHRLVAAADFNNLKPKYDNGQVADDIYETVAVSPVTGKALSVTVAAEGGKGLTPPALSELLKELQALTASMRVRPSPGKATATP
jgi:hypothetical protein